MNGRPLALFQWIDSPTAQILHSTDYQPSYALERDIVQHHEHALQRLAEYRQSTRVVVIISEPCAHCEDKHRWLQLLETSIFGLNTTPVGGDDTDGLLKHGKEIGLSIYLEECSESVDLRYKRFTRQFEFILKQPKHSGLLTRGVDCIFYLLGEPTTVGDWKQVQHEVDVLLKGMTAHQTLVILAMSRVVEVGSRPFEFLVDVWRRIVGGRRMIEALERKVSWRLWCLLEDEIGDLVNVKEMLDFACQNAEENKN